MSKKQFILLILVSLFFLVTINLSLVSADTIILKSGRRVEGKIIEKTDQYTKVEIAGILVTLWSDEIEQVEEIGPMPGQKTIPKRLQEVAPVPLKDIPEPDLLIRTSLDKSIVEKYIAELKQYYLDGEYDDAILSLKKAIELEPTNADFLNDLGVLYYDLGRFQDAISSFERALSINPKNIDAYLCLGIIYDSMGHYEESKRNLAKSIKSAKERIERAGLSVVFISETLLKTISKE